MLKAVPKNHNVRLGHGLTSREFACKCSYEGCVAVFYEQRLVDAFAYFRKFIGKPLYVNSGHRCPQHNFDVGGTTLSYHQRGQAIDISLKTLNHLSREEIEFALKKAGFTFIKFYKTFVHADVRELN